MIAFHAAGDSHPAVASSPLTMNTPMTSRANVLVNVWRQRCHADSPRARRASMASGSDMPVMNRNAGKTTSVIVMPSTALGVCSRNRGVPRTPDISLTKSIRKTSRPRSRSTEGSLTAAGRPVTVTSRRTAGKAPAD